MVERSLGYSIRYEEFKDAEVNGIYTMIGVCHTGVFKLLTTIYTNKNYYVTNSYIHFFFFCISLYSKY